MSTLKRNGESVQLRTTNHKCEATLVLFLIGVVVGWNLVLYQTSPIRLSLVPMSQEEGPWDASIVNFSLLSTRPSKHMLQANEAIPKHSQSPHHPYWIQTTNNSDTAPEECADAMKYVRFLNECHGDCAEMYNISKPLLYWAIMSEQGMGRFIDSAVYTCLRAASLGRPCVVDTSIRDPFYTLRSFLSMPLDVDVAVESTKRHRVGAANLHFAIEEAQELQDALSRLKQPGDSRWSTNDFPDTLTKLYKHILPLVQPVIVRNKKNISENGPDIASSILDSIALHHCDRTVISPNWGQPAFWEKDPKYELLPPTFEVPSSFSPKTKFCNKHNERLITMMENYMFRPTKLATQLHSAYKWKLFRNMTHKDGIEDASYGCVHVRFHLLRTSYKIFPEKDANITTVQNAIQRMAQSLWRFMLSVRQRKHYPNHLNHVTNWWIISDHIDYGYRLVTCLNELAEQLPGSNLVFVTDAGTDLNNSPTTNQGKASTMEVLLDRILSHRHSSAKPYHVRGRKEGTIHHSLDSGSTGVLGHEMMATSIVDWMVLHESDCAIVTEGSFASSGARGRNKSLRTKATSRHLFKLYF